MPKKIRLVITGLQQSGKSVFITSMINNLVYAHQHLNQAPGLKQRGITLVGSLKKTSELPDMKLFPFRRYLESLRKDPPEWPGKTFDLYGCTISLEYGIESRFGQLELEVVDYPGERIIDLGMMGQDFRTWSAQQVEKSLSEERFSLGVDWVCRRDMSRQWHSMLDRLATTDDLTDAAAFELVNEYRKYQGQCLDAGMEFVQPSVVALEHFAVTSGSDYHIYHLDFCPLPPEFASNRNTRRLYRKFGQNYERYIKKFVRPFYRELTRADVQIVLVDVLRMLQRGVQSYNDVRELIEMILENYTYSKDLDRMSWHEPVSKIGTYVDTLFSRQIRKTIFTATKADLLSEPDRPKLAELVRQIVYKWLTHFGITTHKDYSVVTFCAANSATEDGFSSESRQPVLKALVAENGRDAPDKPSVRECCYTPPEIPSAWPDEAWDINKFQYPWKVLPKKLPARDGAAIRNIGLNDIFLQALKDFLPGADPAGEREGKEL